MQENYKILVVDDDMRLRALLERYLTEQGFQVRSVANAEQMDRLLTRESFHLMVLDLMLPGEDGVVHLEGPEVDGERFRLASALGTFGPGEREVQLAALGAAVHVVDHTPAVWGVLFATPEHVDENTLSGGALTDETEDLPGGELGADVVEHASAIEGL